jgi:hypothetical protein
MSFDEAERWSESNGDKQRLLFLGPAISHSFFTRTKAIRVSPSTYMSETPELRQRFGWNPQLD